MLIAGASRHAKDLLSVIDVNRIHDELLFFDDVTKNGPLSFYGKYKILKSLADARNAFKADERFILGLGGTKQRYMVSEKLRESGGVLTSLISSLAVISNHDVILGAGLNVMHFAMISNSVVIGDGSLINAYAALHHDVSIGKFCEISPRATLLGGAKIGSFSMIGAGAVILPNIQVGDNCIVGAGAVVTKHVPSNSTVVGVPAGITKSNIGL